MIQFLIPVIGDVLKRVIPDPKARAEAQMKLAELDQQGELAHLDADVKLALGQLKVNEMEAKSHGIYKGGWRPFMGWVCGLAIAYTYILRPFIEWGVVLAGFQGEVPPNLDLAALWPVIMGMLGLGAMRTYERREFTREAANLAKKTPETFD